jgi:serine/threonine-protein kinase
VPLTLRGKFRLEQRIGRGGMGVVYRATDMHLGRQVAVKTLPWVEPYLTMRLRREARAMAAVSHPNLATIYGVEFFHGIPILVVEYLPGGTLADRLRRGPMPWEEAVVLGIALAEAVDRIHAAGILHRDIKPSNVGFAAGWVPKLLDFGLATAIEAARGLELAAMPASVTAERTAPFGGTDADDLTGAGVVAGTVAYLSPEAVNGQAPDPSFDLWGVSIVLYEAIAGSNPIKGMTHAQAAHSLLFQQIPDIRDAAPSCPPELADFFRDALHLDPRRRPASGSALAQRLRALAKGRSGSHLDSSESGAASPG